MPNAPFLAPERDATWRISRFQGGGATLYTVPGVVAVSGSTFALTNNVDYYFPWVALAPVLIDQLACEVSTAAAASKLLRFGFYRADQSWQPIGAPLADSGDIAADTTGVKTYTPGAPVLANRGRYLSVIASNDLPIMRALISASIDGLGIGTAIGSTPQYDSYKVTRTYAAFPTPGTAWDTLGGGSTQGYKAPVFYRLLAR